MLRGQPDEGRADGRQGTLRPACFRPYRLADVPLVIEWFANIDNPQTRRAYKNALTDFIKFTGIERPDEFREIARAHIIAWRDDLKYRELSGTTIRHRLAALSSLFEYLCDQNVVTHNPVKGIKQPSGRL
jgi:integrase/recombinase XerD